MTTIAQLSQQLTTLNDTLRQTQTLVSRLANWTSQPGSEALDDETGSARLELAQDIHDSLKQLLEDLELLRSDVDELSTDTGIAKRSKGSEKEQERERLASGALRFDEELSQVRTAFRQAQLHAKRSAEAAKAQERELVFKSITTASYLDDADSGSNSSTPVKGHRRGRTQQLTKDEILVNASTDVTAALRRTHDLLSTELSRSRFAQETFDESTEALKDLGEKYSDLDNILTNSRSLLSTLLRSQKSDTWYLETAFYILIATLVWLVFRRVLYGPFIKLPLFLWSLVRPIAYWTILKPLYLFLCLIGVIRSEPVPLKSATAPSPSTSRTPLIIKPSASDFPSAFPAGMAEQMKAGGIPAGMGGQGAKVRQDEALAGAQSEKLAQMAQQSQEATRRGDGTVLQDRGDIPKNPKKKTFEVVDDEPRKDEL